LERRSIYRAAHEASLKHQEELTASLPLNTPESTRVQRSAEAAEEWNRMFFWRWAAHRVIQHVRGEVYWNELGRGSFASVTGENPERGKVVERVLALESGLDDPALEDFARTRRVMAEWAELLNQLLDA